MGEISPVYFEAALASKANLIERCYLNIEAGEFVCYERRIAFRTAAVSLVKHCPDTPVSNFHVLHFWFCIIFLFVRYEDVH